jgi:hypothetical protein
MLVLASMACYSGQVPGFLDLTPYYTETPLPIPDTSRFELGDVALAPSESNRSFFNLTVYPEALDDNLVNSKEMCQRNSPATVLYVGQGADQNLYYLLDCVGSVGWASEDRLLGPLELETGQFALTVLAEGQQKINLIDPALFPNLLQPMALANCQPGTIVHVTGIEAATPLGSPTKEIFYKIDCPSVGGQSQAGWVTGAELLGPLEIRVSDRALALTAPDATFGDPYPMANEPAPISDANTVEGCTQGSVIEAQEARRVNETVYYRMTCGDIEGWVTQEHFVGPLKYDADEDVVIFVPPVQMFADQLSDEQTEQVEGATEAEAAAGEEAPVEEAAPVEETTTDAGDEGQRDVVEVTPPLVLTENPGPAPEGEQAVVVGQCESRTLAHIEEYVGVDQVYYRITCNTQDDQPITGWVEQRYLQGPIEFVPGDTTVFKESSRAVETDDAGAKWARIPATQEGAFALGTNTQYAGRCPLESEVEVTQVYLEKASTSDKFSFYYQVQCTGQPSTYTQSTDSEGKVRREISYNTEASETITGWVMGRELEPLE